MKKLRQDMAAFFGELYEGQQRVLVCGEGDEHADVMLVGEAPGEQETLQGRPFVGKAGKNLDEFLRLSGFDRDQLYVTNAVKFRPVKKGPSGRLSNRAPTSEEVELFLPYLRREIELINPRCVVTLGNTALRALYGKKATVGALHGQFLDFEGRLLFPMYHPASLIYNPSLEEVYRQDVSRLAAWREETL